MMIYKINKLFFKKIKSDYSQPYTPNFICIGLILSERNENNKYYKY